MVAANASTEMPTGYNPPVMPAWINAETGVVDASLMPAAVPMVDQNGNEMFDADGNVLMHQTFRELPSRPQAELDIIAGLKTREQVNAEHAIELQTAVKVQRFGDVPAGIPRFEDLNGNAIAEGLLNGAPAPAPVAEAPAVEVPATGPAEAPATPGTGNLPLFLQQYVEGTTTTIP